MPPTIRAAASLVLYRDNPELEVFLVRRSESMRFFGGYHAFPGGAIESSDAEGPITGADGLAPAERAVIFGAARELFEEIGVLAIADGASDASRPGGSASRDVEWLGDAAGDDFADRLREAQHHVDAAAFRPLARMVTPTFSPVRFDTRFFLVRPPGEPRVRTSELTAGAWRRPAEALDAWKRAEIYIAPPALIILEHLASLSLEEAIAQLHAYPPAYEGSGLAIPWTAGIESLPLYTPPLPKRMPTNVFLVGREQFVVVDPAPKRDKERQHLFAAMERRIEMGHRLLAIVLTHHHIDHVGALQETAERFQLPVWAHPTTGDELGRTLDRTLEEGDTIDLGTAPDGHGDWKLTALFTPGHATGHLALFDPHYGALIAGDLLSTSVSMYVGSPGGHLATYFHSLERVRDLPVDIVFPSHGPPSLRMKELIDENLVHRRRRLDQVHEVLSAEPLAVEVVADRVYQGVDEKLKPLFVRATRAALEYLEETGRARCAGEDLYEGR